MKLMRRCDEKNGKGAFSARQSRQGNAFILRIMFRHLADLQFGDIRLPRTAAYDFSRRKFDLPRHPEKERRNVKNTHLSACFLFKNAVQTLFYFS